MKLVVGHWCAIGAHESCSGAWRGVTCSCDCHGYVDLDHSDVDLVIDNKHAAQAFAAFLRFAAAAGTRRFKLHPAWHAWIMGKGPAPDPTAEVGPDPAP